MEHTSGQWIYESTSPNLLPEYRIRRDKNDDDDRVVGYAYRQGDARRIAAAPDLVKALASLLLAIDELDGQEVHELIEALGTKYKTAQVVLVQATGRNADQNADIADGTVQDSTALHEVKGS